MTTADEIRGMHLNHARIKQIPCPVCGALPGVGCRGPKGQGMQIPHQARRRAAADAGLYVPGDAK
jgi:hypothetical protein